MSLAMQLKKGRQRTHIKILFTPSSEYPSERNLAQLRFNVHDLKTGSLARKAPDYPN